MDWYNGIDLAKAKRRYEEGGPAINGHTGDK